MKFLIQLFCVPLLLSLYCGCDQVSQKLGLPAKSDAPTSPPNTQQTGLQESKPAKAEGAEASAGRPTITRQSEDKAQFNADYEKWKLRAVEEFPEIGIAGSRFNQQFLNEAKKLRESNAPELAHPNWPYLLALQVNTALERLKNSTPPQTSQQGNPSAKIETRTATAHSQDPNINTERFGSYAVSDLTRMRELPRGGVFKGTITKVEKQVASGDLDIVLVLDGILGCEINLDRNTTESRTANGFYAPIFYYRGSSRNSNSLEVIQEQNSLKLVEKNTASSRSYYTGRTYTQTGKRDLLTLSVGQTVSVEGMLLLKANKKPFLKGIIKED